MNIKKFSIYLVLLTIIITLSSYVYYINTNSPALERVIVAVMGTKKSSPEVNKTPVVQTDKVTEPSKVIDKPIQVNTYLVITLILLCLNLITVMALLKVLAWRKTAANGMMAVVPTDVINSLGIVSQNQNKLAKWLQSEVSVISKSLLDHAQSITILKKELESKDEELSYFKSGALSKEKDKIISKLVRLHSFLKTLEEQVLAGGVKHDVAISFLKDELADLFVEFNITEINPAPLTPIKNLPVEGYAVKEIIRVDDVVLNQTVAELLDSGYYLNFANGKGKVIKAAAIKINKFGE